MKRTPPFPLRATVLALLCLATPLDAASKAELDALYDAMRTDELIDIMASEGIAEGEGLRDDMLGGKGGLGWSAVLATIYEHPRMVTEFRAVFDAELADTDVTPLLEFFTSEVGRNVALYEVEGRRAMSEDDVEQAAIAAFEDLDRTSRRHRLLTDFIALNDLVEHNVAGAMTSNLAFFKGLGEGGGVEMPEAEMLATVWGREEEIRADTTEWIGGYLAFTYDPLSDDDLSAYIALSETRPGRALNRALFAAFYDVYKRISFDLGKSVSSFMVTEEL